MVLLGQVAIRVMPRNVLLDIIIFGRIDGVAFEGQQAVFHQSKYPKGSERSKGDVQNGLYCFWN